jgi:prolyl 4-hydroxylase
MTIITLITLLLFLLIISLYEINSNELEVDVDGNIQTNDIQYDNDSLQINVFNDYDEILYIYWSAGDNNNNDNDILITQLNPSEDSIINTFDGHTFYGIIDNFNNNKIRAEPYQITISKHINNYKFSPLSKDSIVKNDHPHPAIKILDKKSYSVAAKFRCLLPACDYYYDDGKGGSFQGTLNGWGKETTTNSYAGHVFFFTEKGDKSKEVARFTIKENQFLYVVSDESRPPPKELMEQLEKEKKFGEEYLKRTGNIWRHYFGPNGPRSPPVLYMWPANEIGQIHTVSTYNGKWTCNDPIKCRSKDKMEMRLEVVSMQPKAFIISEFLSEFEAEEIMKIATPIMGGSTVGNRDGGGSRRSETRTSRNAWVARDSSPVIDTIYRRAADLLNIDEKLLTSHKNAEDMQVVHYELGQKYDSHHDWGVSGYPESRFITLLLYLTDQLHPNAGGETAFPKGLNGRGFKVHPGKGSAVLFYNLLEDGNGDDLALHAALPVLEGNKSLANFWIWDAKRKS